MQISQFAGQRIGRDRCRHGDEDTSHNLSEVIDGLIAVIDDPTLTLRNY
ncbi:MAG: hypothetical protein R2864_14325 [Syntrophotaleaceae bacterium]